MKLKHVLFVALAVCGLTAQAQEVDKAAVQSQVSAAEKAKKDLEKVDTGDKAWKFSGSVGLNAAATGLVNWAAGGNNNINGVAYTRLRLLYHGNNIAWDTNLDLEYGLSWIDQEYDKLQKSNDKISLATKFGWEFQKNWYLTVLGAFNTQFAPGLNYNGTADADPIVSKFMAPGYIDVSVGVDWKTSVNGADFSLYLSPVAGRLTTVVVGPKMNQYFADKADYQKAGMYQLSAAEEAAYGATGLEYALKDKYAVWRYNTDETTGKVNKSYEKNTRAELGLNIKGAINYTYKDFKLQTTLGLYTPYAWDKTRVYEEKATGDMYADLGTGATYPEATYKYLGFRDNNRRFGNFDVDWTVNLSYQFLKCLQVTLSTDLRYYNGVKIANKAGDEAERVQFKGMIGLGVGYSF